MMDKQFWTKLAENWVKEDDGLNVPDIPESQIKEYSSIMDIDEIDEDIDDILAELDIEI